MAQRSETFVDGFEAYCGPWQTIFNGTVVPPANLPAGYWGNQPGGASCGAYFQNHARRRIVKIGMQWQAGVPNNYYDGTGLVLTFLRNGGSDTYAPTGVALDCKAMGLPADGVYREYTLPTLFVARGISWFKGFDDYRIPFNGAIQKIRVFTDDFAPVAITRGSIQTVPGTTGPLTLTGVDPNWEIVRENGDLVSYAGFPRGWQVAWNGYQFVVKPPPDAEIHDDYQVRLKE